LNRQYIPFLLRRFPGSHFKILSKPDKNPLDPPPFALVFVPLPQIPGDTLDRWRQADLVYRQVNIDIKNKSPYAPWIDYSKSFSRIQDLSSMDPFLMAVYFEKTAFFQFLGGDFQSAARSYEQAIKKGLPAAHLFYNLGVCLHICGREKEADQVTQKATQLATQLALETGDSP
jgi:tetratricopeptide (TPR) repeat protein